MRREPMVVLERTKQNAFKSDVDEALSSCSECEAMSLSIPA
jgi:hypothetical protein